jgi:hypothetical protein
MMPSEPKKKYVENVEPFRGAIIAKDRLAPRRKKA